LNFIYRVYAIERMFQRDISEYIVQKTIIDGEVIEKYLDKPIHVVYAKNADDIIIITVYRPDKSKWTDNYKIRLKK